jgi:hypothetical protein
MIEKTMEINLLHDFYAPLLTQKQRVLLELYYHENWSLSEIAEHQGVSRQAINEAIKRAQTSLYRFEYKLKLLEKHQERIKIMANLLQQLQPESKAIAGPLLKMLVDLD